MQQKEEAQKAECEPKIIAIVLNGAEYNLLRTPKGLRWCLAKYFNTPSRHLPIATLHDLVENVRLGQDDVEIWASSDPNAEEPELDLWFESFRDLENNGLNIVSTGSGIARVTNEHSAFRA